MLHAELKKEHFPKEQTVSPTCLVC